MNHSKYILFLDDEQDNRFSFRALFRRNYSILLASNVAEAKRLVDQFPVDMVVSDQRMPDQYGLEFFGWLRSHKPGIIRILVSGSISNKVIAKALQQGEIHAWIAKPWKADELKEIIRKLLLKN